MFLKAVMTVKHSKHEASIKSEDDKNKRAKYLALWQQHFENVIVERLDETEFMESLTFYDCLEIFTPDEANFACRLCGKNWYSAKAMIVFLVSMNDGELNIRRDELRQKCSHCATHYELPTVRLTLIPEILEEVLMYILEDIYKIMDHGIEERQPKKRHRRRSDLPHDSANCQACEIGVCGKKTKRRRQKQNESDLSVRLDNLSIKGPKKNGKTK